MFIGEQLPSTNSTKLVEGFVTGTRETQVLLPNKAYISQFYQRHNCHGFCEVEHYFKSKSLPEASRWFEVGRPLSWGFSDSKKFTLSKEALEILMVEEPSRPVYPRFVLVRPVVEVPYVVQGGVTVVEVPEPVVQVPQSVVEVTELVVEVPEPVVEVPAPAVQVADDAEVETLQVGVDALLEEIRETLETLR